MVMKKKTMMENIMYSAGNPDNTHTDKFFYGISKSF